MCQNPVFESASAPVPGWRRWLLPEFGSFSGEFGGSLDSRRSLGMTEYSRFRSQASHFV